jgi:hypothetical protein
MWGELTSISDVGTHRLPLLYPRAYPRSDLCGFECLTREWE